MHSNTLQISLFLFRDSQVIASDRVGICAAGAAVTWSVNNRLGTNSLKDWNKITHKYLGGCDLSDSSDDAVMDNIPDATKDNLRYCG